MTVFDANTVLGRVALFDNQIEKAENFLIKASQTPGSAVLSSFGPDFSLARELLIKGKKKTVIKAIDNYGKFWMDGKDKLPKIKAEIKNKGTMEQATFY